MRKIPPSTTWKELAQKASKGMMCMLAHITEESFRECVDRYGNRLEAAPIDFSQGELTVLENDASIWFTHPGFEKGQLCVCNRDLRRTLGDFRVHIYID